MPFKSLYIIEFCLIIKEFPKCSCRSFVKISRSMLSRIVFCACALYIVDLEGLEFDNIPLCWIVTLHYLYMCPKSGATGRCNGEGIKYSNFITKEKLKANFFWFIVHWAIFVKSIRLIVLFYFCYVSNFWGTCCNMFFMSCSYTYECYPSSMPLLLVFNYVHMDYIYCLLVWQMELIRICTRI